MRNKLLELSGEINRFALWKRFLPHDYRPKELWYKLKCLCWKRYSTVKPRWLPHTWIDRGDLLHYIAFELLVQFLDNEAHIILWEADERYYDYQEMLRLRDWWENRYLKADKLIEHLYLYQQIDPSEDVLEPIPNTNFYKMREPTVERKEIWNEINRINAQLSAELEANLAILINLRYLMWS